MYNDFMLIQRLVLYGMCASAIIALHRWVLLMMPWRRLLGLCSVFRDTVGLSDLAAFGRRLTKKNTEGTAVTTFASWSMIHLGWC